LGFCFSELRLSLFGNKKGRDCDLFYYVLILKVNLKEVCKNQQTPSKRKINQRHKHRRAANIFGAASQRMRLKRSVIYRGFNCRIKQLYNINQQSRADEQNALYIGVANIKRQGQKYNHQPSFLPNRCLVFVRRFYARPRITSSFGNAREAIFTFKFAFHFYSFLILSFAVIPAKAGIHFDFACKKAYKKTMDPRLREDDGVIFINLDFNMMYDTVFSTIE
jgi:hypothetical protein